MTVADLRQVRLSRQHLTSPTDKRTVVRDLCGLQCQILSNAFHALRTRCAEPLDPDRWGEGLVKNWTLRGTVHVFAEEDLPLFKYDDDNYRSDRWDGVPLPGRWWVTPEREAYFAGQIVRLVSDGVEERDDLRTACRALGMTPDEESFLFDGWGGLLRPLCERGFLTYKVCQKKAFALAPAYTPLPREDALREQFRRYLTHIAPATVRDMAYFFHFSQTQVKQFLQALPVNHFTMDGTDYFYLGDLPTDCPDVPACLFLAGFDQLLLGYEKRKSVYLPPEFLRGIFNLAGIVMPGILLNGRVAGRWKRKGKALEITPFRPFTAAEKRSVEAAADSLWSGGAQTIRYLS